MLRITHYDTLTEIVALRVDVVELFGDARVKFVTDLHDKNKLKHLTSAELYKIQKAGRTVIGVVEELRYSITPESPVFLGSVGDRAWYG